MTCLVAIDGPAGAGKSTVARAVAARLGVAYLDTGAMYRAVTWLAGERGVDLDDVAAVAALAAEPVDFAIDGQVTIAGLDATPHLRDDAVSARVSRVAANPDARRGLVAQQHAWLARRDGVAEGRDIADVVAPDAPVKVFLTATAGERSRRHGTAAVLERDARDHATTPLAPVPGATVIDTSDLPVDVVVDRIVALARATNAPSAAPAAAGTAGEDRRARRGSWLYFAVRSPIGPLFLLLWRVRIRGAELVPRTGPIMFCSNHISNLDPIFLAAATRRHVRFMAKSELWKIPVLGRLLSMAGTIKVRRGESDREAVREARAVIRTGGALGVFPEGTRHRDGVLRPGRPGAGMLALAPGVRVVPVCIEGTNRVVAGRRLRFPRVTVTFGSSFAADRPPGSRSRASRAATEQIMAAIAHLQGVAPPGVE